MTCGTGGLLTGGRRKLRGGNFYGAAIDPQIGTAGLAYPSVENLAANPVTGGLIPNDGVSGGRRRTRNRKGGRKTKSKSRRRRGGDDKEELAIDKVARESRLPAEAAPIEVETSFGPMSVAELERGAEAVKSLPPQLQPPQQGGRHRKGGRKTKKAGRRLKKNGRKTRRRRGGDDKEELAIDKVARESRLPAEAAPIEVETSFGPMSVAELERGAEAVKSLPPQLQPPQQGGRHRKGGRKTKKAGRRLKKNGRKTRRRRGGVDEEDEPGQVVEEPEEKPIEVKEDNPTLPGGRHRKLKKVTRKLKKGGRRSRKIMRGGNYITSSTVGASYQGGGIAGMANYSPYAPNVPGGGPPQNADGVYSA